MQDLQRPDYKQIRSKEFQRQRQPEPESFFNNPTASLVTSIICLIFCCIIAPGTIVLSIIALAKKKSGEIASAQNYALVAMFINIVGIIIGIIYFVLTLVFDIKI